MGISLKKVKHIFYFKKDKKRRARDIRKKWYGKTASDKL